MCVPDFTLYSLIPQLIYALLGSTHRASTESATQLVWSLLLCQSLHPSDLARSLPALRTTRARQALRRIRRAIDCPHLSSRYLSQFLIRAALRIVSDAEVMLILDSTRCICWEIFTLGIMFHGRVLPVAWQILPYPWPKKQFTPNVVALVNRTLSCWPCDRRVNLLADRGFPSLKLFRVLDGWRKTIPLGYTIRLRAADWVRLQNGQTVKIAELINGVVPGVWASCLASYQRRSKAGMPALLVFGRGVPIYPAHQTGPTDQARRLARENRRKAHLRSKHQAKAPETDGIWVLLSTAVDDSQAREQYAYRFRTEGMYRDLKSWDLEVVARHENDAEYLDRLLGLVALGYFVQAALGAMAGRANDEKARARQRQWTTTDRVSIFWRGRQVLHDRAHDWRSWLRATLPEIACQINPHSSLRYQASTPPPSSRSKEAA